jgi:glycosyltransferase involved in cell wall biosynthesis
MIRLGHFVTHPIQYFAPLYRALSARDDVQLTVLFGSRFGLQPSFDEGFGKTIQFDVPLLSGYRHRFLDNRGSGEPTRGAGNFDCPGLDAVCREEKFDAVWVHGWAYRAQRQAIDSCRKRGVPYLIRAETTLLLKPRWSLRWLGARLMLGRMLRGAGACLYVGKSNRDFYASMGVVQSRLFPAHYSVDAARFRDAAGDDEGRRRLRREHGADEETCVVVASSKAIERKRLDDAIRAVGRLGPDVRLWVLGDGPLRPRLEELARREAPCRVVWHGFVNQSRIPPLLAAADVFVMPSQDEPWGLSVNEAMAVGLPAVCSDGVGCAADLVRPGETGHTYPAGDVAALANCLEELRVDREKRRRMGAAARDLVLTEYDVSATARQIAAAVGAVCAQSASVQRSHHV